MPVDWNAIQIYTLHLLMQVLLDIENKINVFAAISVTTDNNGRLQKMPEAFTEA